MSSTATDSERKSGFEKPDRSDEIKREESKFAMPREVKLESLKGCETFGTRYERIERVELQVSLPSRGKERTS